MWSKLSVFPEQDKSLAFYNNGGHDFILCFTFFVKSFFKKRERKTLSRKLFVDFLERLRTFNLKVIKVDTNPLGHCVKGRFLQQLWITHFPHFISALKSRSRNVTCDRFYIRRWRSAFLGLGCMTQEFCLIFKLISLENHQKLSCKIIKALKLVRQESVRRFAGTKLQTRWWKTLHHKKMLNSSLSFVGKTRKTFKTSL